MTATAPPLLTPATERRGLDALAELFNRAYEGYEVPLHVDAGAVEFMFEAFDLRPEHSRIAWRDGSRDRPGRCSQCAGRARGWAAWAWRPRRGAPASANS